LAFCPEIQERNTMGKTKYFENKFESSDCRDCYFGAHFKEWIQVEVLKIQRRD
jgi:hypothetical protein